MKLDETKITKAIVETYFKKLLDTLEVDVAVVGGGPAGLTAAYYLSKEKAKVALFERKLSLGGGMWGGGMMFNEIVVQDRGKELLDEFDIRTKEQEKGYYTADSIECVTTIASKTVKSGAKIFNLISAEDVMMEDGKVTGVVLNWTSVEMANLHVDPLAIRSKYVIDATGHASEIAHIIQKKIGPKLSTKSGKVEGEKSMCAHVGEESLEANTKEVYPGVYVAGMAANAVFGSPRMGAIFGGMLLSGKRAADIIKDKIK